MKLQSIFISIILFSACFSFGQTAQNKAFESFASRQDSLFIKAYEQRDTAQYQQLLKEFEKKYNQLSANEKHLYANSYQNAYYNLCCTYSLVNNKPIEYMI